MEMKILVIPKLSKYELDLHRLGLHSNALKEFYSAENIQSDRIIESHNTQKENLEKLKKAIPQAVFIHREQLTKEITRKFDLVIAFGGDNHLQFVSHYIEDTPLLGINSDTIRSKGGLLPIDTEKFCDNVSDIMKSNFNIENWTRLEISIDGKKIPWLATSEVFIGEQERTMMSRHILEFKDKRTYQKGSGLIVTTGAGSTGWYKSASKFLNKNESFPLTTNKAKFLLMEPHDFDEQENINGEINETQTLNIQSLNDSCGIISIDSHRIFKLKEGSKVEIKLGKPLKIVRLKN